MAMSGGNCHDYIDEHETTPPTVGDTVLWTWDPGNPKHRKTLSMRRHTCIYTLCSWMGYN